MSRPHRLKNGRQSNLSKITRPVAAINPSDLPCLPFDHRNESWKEQLTTNQIDIGDGMELSRCQANTWTMTVDDESSFLTLDHFNSLRTDKPLQGKSEGFDSCDWPSNLKLDSNHWFFSLEIWWMTSKNNRYFFYIMSSIVHHFNSIGWIWNWSYSPDTLNSDWNWRYFVLCYLEIWLMTLENNRAHLLYYRYIKLCASFQIHRWNQCCVTVRKLLIRVNIDFFVLCDLEIQWMTLKNKRAPLLYYIKLCASFQSHGWIQTGVTVRKRSIRVKISIFFVSCDPWNLTDDHEKL